MVAEDAASGSTCSLEIADMIVSWSAKLLRAAFRRIRDRSGGQSFASSLKAGR
jgi:hypothetical protein